MYFRLFDSSFYSLCDYSVLYKYLASYSDCIYMCSFVASAPFQLAGEFTMELTIGMYADGSRYIAIYQHFPNAGIRKWIATVTYYDDERIQFQNGMDNLTVIGSIKDAMSFLVENYG